MLPPCSAPALPVGPTAVPPSVHRIRRMGEDDAGAQGSAAADVGRTLGCGSGAGLRSRPLSLVAGGTASEDGGGGAVACSSVSPRSIARYGSPGRARLRPAGARRRWAASSTKLTPCEWAPRRVTWVSPARTSVVVLPRAGSSAPATVTMAAGAHGASAGRGLAWAFSEVAWLSSSLRSLPSCARSARRQVLLQTRPRRAAPL